jgi:hypothetical protein
MLQVHYFAAQWHRLPTRPVLEPNSSGFSSLKGRQKALHRNYSSISMAKGQQGALEPTYDTTASIRLYFEVLVIEIIAKGVPKMNTA